MLSSYEFQPGDKVKLVDHPGVRTYGSVFTLVSRHSYLDHWILESENGVMIYEYQSNFVLLSTGISHERFWKAVSVCPITGKYFSLNAPLPFCTEYSLETTAIAKIGGILVFDNLAQAHTHRHQGRIEILEVDCSEEIALPSRGLSLWRLRTVAEIRKIRYVNELWKKEDNRVKSKYDNMLIEWPVHTRAFRSVRPIKQVIFG